jgi:hypothetical protein
MTVLQITYHSIVMYLFILTTNPSIVTHSNKKNPQVQMFIRIDPTLPRFWRKPKNPFEQKSFRLKRRLQGSIRQNSISAENFIDKFYLQFWGKFPPRTTYKYEFTRPLCTFILILRRFKELQGQNYKLYFDLISFYPQISAKMV